MPATTEDATMKTGLIHRFAWLIILACALGISGWSLFYVARHEGAPIPVALVVSACVDGAALVCADLAMDAMTKGYSAAAPRLAVWIFAGAGAWLNSYHAIIAHESSFVRVLWAVPSITAVVVYEFRSRSIRQGVLTKQHKNTPPLPTMGALSWLLFPRETFTSTRKLVAYQRRRMLERYAPGAFSGFPEGKSESFSGPPESFSGPRESFPAPPESFPGREESSLPVIESSSVSSIVPIGEIRTWAKGKGYPVNERGSLPADIIQRYYSEKEA